VSKTETSVVQMRNEIQPWKYWVIRGGGELFGATSYITVDDGEM
jgi:hypothetical protein